MSSLRHFGTKRGESFSVLLDKKRVGISDVVLGKRFLALLNKKRPEFLQSLKARELTLVVRRD